MNTVSLTPSIVERYLAPLINLSDNMKLEIISRLSASMLKVHSRENKTSEQVDLYTCFQGDWGSEQSTDAYCQDLRTDAITEAEETET